MKFSNDWFNVCINEWNWIVPQYDPSKILEIGSYEGRSACHLIQMLGNKHPMNITCVDTWKGGAEHEDIDMAEVERTFDANIQECVDSAKFPIEVRKMKTTSWKALAQLITEGKSGTFDMIYVDGSHETPDVLGDAVMAFDLLRVEGLLIFDDYLWGQGPGANPLENPKMAIDSFLNCFQRKMFVHQRIANYQLYCRKL